MARTLSAPVAAEKDLKFNRPFLSAVFHFGGSVGDIFVADNDIVINGVAHKGIALRWAEFRSIVRPRDGSFQLGKIDGEICNAPLFGVPAKRFSDLWTGLAPEAVEVDLYQNFLQADDPATVLQDKIHRFVMRPVEHTPERAKVEFISASEKYVDKKELSFPLSEVALPLIKREEIGKTAHSVYGRPKFVRAHQASGFPTSVLAGDMTDSQTTLPLYPEWNALLPASGTIQIGTEQVTWGSGGSQPTVTTQHLDSNISTSNAASYVTASITPAANKLILVWVGNRKNGGSTAPTLSGGGITTWVRVKTITGDGGDYRLTLFRGHSASPGTGTITIAFGGNVQEGCSWSVVQHSNVDVSIDSGIVQFASNSNGVNVNLGAFSSPSNATAAGFLVKGATSLTPGSGFTQLASLSGNNFRFLTEWRADADTTANASQSGGSEAVLGIAVEIKLGNVSADVTVQRGANGTDAEAHAKGDPVVFFPAQLVYLLAGHSLTSVDKVYVQRSGRRVPVKSSRYSVNLADTSLIAGKTVTSLTMTVPPLKEERLYKQTVDGQTATLTSGGTITTKTFTFSGGQHKTKSSGKFKYTISWHLLTPAEPNLKLSLVRGASHSDVTLYRSLATAADISVEEASPFVFLDDHFHSGSTGDKLQMVLEITSGTAGGTRTVDIDQISVEYLVASALDDPLPDLGTRSEEQVQEADGGSLTMSAGVATAQSLTITFGAQLKPKSSGKYRYDFTWSYWGEPTNMKLEVLRNSDSKLHPRIVLMNTNQAGDDMVRADHNVSFECNHYHNANDANRFEIKLSTKLSAPSERSLAKIGLVTVRYNVAEPGADVEIQPLMPLTAADLIVDGDVVFDAQGYKDDGSGTYTGTADALIERAPDVIQHLLRVPGGVPSAYVDAASFAQARDDQASYYKLSGVITERTNILKEALLALCGQSALKLDFPVDKFTARALPATYPAPPKTLTEARVAPGSLRVFAGPVSDIINSGNVRYGRDWSVGRSERAYTGVIAFSDSASITKYGERKQDTRFWFDFIDGDNTAMAQDQADFWLARLKEPPRMAGLRAYLDEYEILPGDLRAIKYLMPDGVEYYDGLDGTQKFLAEEVAHVMGAPAQGSMRLMNLTLRQVS